MSIFVEKKKRKNTKNLKYDSLKETHLKDLEKITSLQQKTICLLEELRNRDKELLELREREMERLRKEKKK